MKICKLTAIFYLFTALIFSATSEQDELGESVLFGIGGTIIQNVLFSEYSLSSQNRQDQFITNLYSSVPGTTVIVQGDPCNFILQNVLEANVYLSMDGQQSWNSAPFILMDIPGYENSWESVINTAGGANSTWFAQVILSHPEGETYHSQAPINLNDEFPPPQNLMIEMANEPAGDVENGEPVLDLIDVKCGYSDERLYVQIMTEEGGFPLGEFFGPWHLYGVGFSNPVQDLGGDQVVVYALGYANGAFGNLHIGLLKLVATPAGDVITFDYLAEPDTLGSVEYEISENVLNLSVATHYITDDPDFGEWPNEYGGFMVTGMTASADIDQNFEYHDGTLNSILVIETQIQNGNQAPELSAAQYDSENNQLSIVYSDPDGNLPIERTVTIDEVVEDMTPLDHIYYIGAEFFYQIEDGITGDFTAQFDFSDGAEAVQTTLDFTINPPVCNMPGDANYNGVVNVVDIIFIISQVLGVDFYYDLCADINLDGDVDILDVVAIVELVLTVSGE